MNPPQNEQYIVKDDNIKISKITQTIYGTISGIHMENEKLFENMGK